MTAAGDHLHELSASGWSLWRWIFVRGAGFPAEMVLELEAPAACAALDRLLELEDELQGAAARAIAAAERELTAHPSERRAITALLRRLRSGEVPDAGRAPSTAAAAALETLRAA
ncbi:MAG TPA: hypothetical protein VN253_07890, partial [Kofleriaceae bacterium]|nr:hypothetical protein [Kofleriaceae bacterium]